LRFHRLLGLYGLKLDGLTVQMVTIRLNLIIWAVLLQRSLIPVPICVYLSLLEVGNWLGESRVSSLLKLWVNGAPDAT